MKKFVIEVLYPEFNNLYGDTGNILYLTKKLEKSPVEIEIINTNFTDIPAFVGEKQVDFLYIGPSSEKNQLLQIEKLKQYKEKIEERINSGLITIATGNAFEIFGDYIKLVDDTKFEALGIFDYYSQRFDKLRYNDLSLGMCGDLKIVGYKNQLSHSYPVSEKYDNFIEIKLGSGFNKEYKKEGIRIKNFVATYVLGPILAINPPFTDNLLRDYLGENYILNELEYEKEAYEIRLKELEAIL